jgi:UDP-N-acetylmuramate dehydrogenase
LREYTRFGLGGPAKGFADVWTPEGLAEVLATPGPHVLIGGGSNLVVADEGYAGTVIRYRDSQLRVDGDRIVVGAGVDLQELVDASIQEGFEGLHTMTGIPGWVGGAVYGNAGAYGHSVHEFLETVRFWDGTRVREFTNAECEFRYRESIFKRHKDWVVLNATFRLPRSTDREKTREEAVRILNTRNEKFPPTMKCAGSIFKNLLLAELPPEVQMQVPRDVVREGKVAAAYFLEQVGAKGMFAGGIRVAEYHANLIYNTGDGTSAQVRHLIEILKDLVFEHFRIHVEEEVQFI